MSSDTRSAGRTIWSTFASNIESDASKGRASKGMERTEVEVERKKKRSGCDDKNRPVLEMR